MPRVTQCDRILRHLRDHGSITHAEAQSEYGIARLGARIFDLKKMGYTIVTEHGKGKNRYGEPIWFSVYRLEE